VFGVSNATEAKTNMFQIWKPKGNKFFETFSYLPPLSDAELAKQVDYLIRKGYTPCIEFEDQATAFSARTAGIDSSAVAGYYDNRYWSMWKLPMFGATDSDAVIREIKTCAAKFPNSFVRLAGFDGNRQVQCVGMIVARPRGSEALPVDQRRVSGN